MNDDDPKPVVWSAAETARGHKTLAGKSGFGRKADKYLIAIRGGANSAQALEEAKMSPASLGSLRKRDDFVAAEIGAFSRVKMTAEDVAPLREKLATEWYIQALKDHAGNRTKAREAACISRERYAKLAESPEFREAEIGALESIVDAIEEQSTRIATGDSPKARDSQHVRWTLERLRKELYGAQPKVHEHRYSGAIKVETVDDEINRLLRLGGQTIEDGEIVSGS